MIALRVLRALRLVWPLAFIAPLWTIAARLCWESPLHVALSAVMLLHAYLPALLAAAAIAAVGVVVTKIVHVGAALRTLESLSSRLPDRIALALAAEAGSMERPLPRAIFLDLEAPMCYTLAPGPTILISQGFVRDLDDAGLAHVVRHELAHVARRDPQRALCWHLLFSALLVPGFGDLERWLYDRREEAASRLAEGPSAGRFAALALRVRIAESHLERSLGPAYAGAFARVPAARHFYVRPALASAVLIALLASHAFFLQALPMTEIHHC